MKKVSTFGFIVVEKAEEWEQPLGLAYGPGFPERGLLSWLDADAPRVAVFTSTREARAAIKRTELYARATEKPDLYVRLKHCTVLPVALIAAPSS